VGGRGWDAAEHAHFVVADGHKTPATRRGFVFVGCPECAGFATPAASARGSIVIPAAENLHNCGHF